MRIDWTKIGESETNGNRKKIQSFCENMNWQLLPCTMPMMPGYAIQETIRVLHIPKVSHVAFSNAPAPYGLCGIRAHYKNADVDVFILDKGTCVRPLCMFVNEKQATV